MFLALFIKKFYLLFSVTKKCTVENLKHLVTHLRVEDDKPDENILEAVDMENYESSRIGTTHILFDDGGGGIDPIPVGAGGVKPVPEYDTLENIVSTFNQTFGNIDWGKGVDKQVAENILGQQIPQKIKDDLQRIMSIKNSDKQNGKITFDKKVMSLMQNLLTTHTGIYKKFVDDPYFKRRYQDFIFDLLMQQARDVGRK